VNGVANGDNALPNAENTMKSSVRYEWYSVATISNDAPSLPQHQRASLKADVMCCRYPKVGLTTIDAIIDRKRIKNQPISNLFAFDLPLVHQEWLELLPPDVVAAEVYIGRVLTAERDPVEGWVSFRPRRRTFDRGKSSEAKYGKVLYDRCPRCSRALYWAPPPWYLSKHLKPGVRIFGGSMCGLIIHHSLMGNLYKRKHWKKYCVEGMQVIDPPLDDITENIDIEF
jgi:hypothetical protein